MAFSLQSLPALQIRQPNLAKTLAAAAQIKGARLANRLSEARINRMETGNRLVSQMFGESDGAATAPGDIDPATYNTLSAYGGPTAEAGAALDAGVTPPAAVAGGGAAGGGGGMFGSGVIQSKAFKKYMALDPERAEQLFDILTKADDAQIKEYGRKIDMMGRAAMILQDLPREQRPMAYPQLMGELQEQGIDVSDAPPQYDEKWVNLQARMALTAKDLLDERQREIKRRADNVQVMVNGRMRSVPKDQLPALSKDNDITQVGKPTALSEKINVLVSSGVPRGIAQGIAAGRYAKDRHPMSGALQVVDMSTGQVIYRAGEQSGDQPSGGQVETLPQSTVDPNVDYSQGTGASGAFGRPANVVSDILGAGLVAPEAEKAAQGLTNLQVRTQTGLQAAIPGRPSNYLMQQLEKLTVTPNSIFQGDARSRERLILTKAMLQQEIARMEGDILSRQGDFKPQQISEIRASVSELKGLLRDYEVVLKSFGAKSNLSEEDDALVKKYLK